MPCSKIKGGSPAKHHKWRNSIYDVIQSRAQEQGTLGRGADVLPGRRQPGQLLPALGEASAPDEAETAVRAAIQEVASSTVSARTVSSNHRRSPPPGNAGQSQTCCCGSCARTTCWPFAPQDILTTDSRHELRGISEPGGADENKGVNQLWVADITYIRLRKEFVYLAVIIDPLLPQGYRMGVGPEFKRQVAIRRWKRRWRGGGRRRASSSLRSRHSVCLARLYRDDYGNAA